MNDQITKTAKESRKAWLLIEQMKEEALVNNLLDHYSKAHGDTKSKKPLFKFFKDWESATMQSYAMA